MALLPESRKLSKVGLEIRRPSLSIIRRAVSGSPSEMTRNDRIRQTLIDALQPEKIEIIDESNLHAGHSGARPEGETHFRIEIVASKFVAMNRVERQRLIHSLLADEFAAGLHALSIKALAPE